MAYRLAKSLEKLRSQLNEMFPQRSKESDGWIGDAKHASRNSDHNPWIKDKNGIGVVSAIDVTFDIDPSDGIGVDAKKLSEILSKNADPRVKYLIFNRRITQKSNVSKWKSYTGISPHEHHIHISVKSESRFFDDDSPWKLDGLKPARAIIQKPAQILLNSATSAPADNQPQLDGLPNGGANNFVAPPAGISSSNSDAANNSANSADPAQPPIQSADNINNFNSGSNAAVEQPDQPFKQYLPNINKEKVLLGGGIIGTAIANIAAWAGNLSLPAQIVLGSLFVMLVGGLIWLVVSNRREINQLVREAMGFKADKSKNSPVLVTEKPETHEQLPRPFKSFVGDNQNI